VGACNWHVASHMQTLVNSHALVHMTLYCDGPGQLRLCEVLAHCCSIMARTFAPCEQGHNATTL
jgi:hypothetical protein